MRIQDWILCIMCMAVIVFLFCSCKWAEAQHNNKWRILFLIPVMAVTLHIGLAGGDWCLTGIYIGGLITVAGFFTTKVSLRQKSLVAAMILCVAAVPCCYGIGSYRNAHYVADFEEGFACMKEHYSLSVHKNVDWDGLYAEYLPLFQEVEATQDAVANYMTWTAFCNEFNDGHVSYTPKEDAEDLMQAAEERVAGNDYGLATVCLDSGEYVAVLVEENGLAYEAGIRTGTVITRWDGKAPEEWLETCAKRMSQTGIYGNQENLRFYEGCFLAGIGGEQVTVTFMNTDGVEETVTLEAIGSYRERLKQVMEHLTYKEPRANVSVTALNENTILLNTNVMSFDSASTNSSDYGSVQAAIREQLIPYRENGATNLIIDLRQNGGGSTKMAQAIVALVAEGEHFWAADGAYNKTTGAYEIVNTYTYVGENIWDGGEIIVLTDSQSNSAANHCMGALQQLEHVTVMGLTEPAGTAQGIVGTNLENGALSFSGTLVLNEEGEIWIDTDETGEPRLRVDERIPLTQEALQGMFETEEDYVLHYAVEAFE